MRDLQSNADWKIRVAEGLPPEIAEETPLDLFGLITGLPPETAQIPWDGLRVRIIDHPAHAQGHAALFIEERGVLGAGDMLSDVFIPMLDDFNGTNDPIEDYLVGLRLLEGVADDVDVLIPGHGLVGGADQVRDRIEQDRAYVQALRDGHDPDDPRIGPSAKPGWEWVGDIHVSASPAVRRKKRTRSDARLAIRLRHSATLYRPADDSTYVTWIRVTDAAVRPGHSIGRSRDRAPSCSSVRSRSQRHLAAARG